MVTPKNSGTTKISNHPIIERFTRTHISIPITLFLMYSFGLLYWSIVTLKSSPLLTFILFIFGFLTFTLAEYLIHRHLFHMKLTSRVRKKMQYIMHGVHHEFPKDKDRLAMPPLVSLLISTLLLFLLWLIIDDHVFGFLPGFLTGYASYLFVHYIVHAFQPPRNFFKILWINHSIHHYKDSNIAFGVSSPLWDYIFGTLPR